MKILGRAAARTAAAQQAREARNQRAMDSMVGMAVDSRAFVDGRGEFAAPITTGEIDTVIEVLTRAQDFARVYGLSSEQPDYRAAEIRRALQLRRGATWAVDAHPEFTPLFAEEIESFTAALAALQQSQNTLYMPKFPELRLLGDLRMRLGHAEALEYLGTIPVFRPAAGSGGAVLARVARADVQPRLVPLPASPGDKVV